MIKDVNWYNVAYGTQCLHVTTNNTHIIVKQAGRRIGSRALAIFILKVFGPI